MIHFPLTPGSAIDLGNPVADVALNEGLAAWWLATPGAAARGGNRFLDLCGKNHGTLTNGPTWGGALGRLGGWGSLTFDGTNDLVACGSGGELLNAITITAWIYLTSAANSYPMIIAKSNTFNITTSKWGLWLGGAAGTDETLTFKAGGAAIDLNTIAIPINEWVFVGVSADASGSVSYVRTSSGVTTATGNAIENPTYAGENLTIGSWRHAGGGPFPGNIADIRLSNVKFSTDMLAAVDLDSRAGYPTTLNRIRLPVFGEAGGGGGGLSIPVAMHNYRRRRVA